MRTRSARTGACAQGRAYASCGCGSGLRQDGRGGGGRRSDRFVRNVARRMPRARRRGRGKRGDRVSERSRSSCRRRRAAAAAAAVAIVVATSATAATAATTAAGAPPRPRSMQRCSGPALGAIAAALHFAAISAVLVAAAL